MLPTSGRRINSASTWKTAAFVTSITLAALATVTTSAQDAAPARDAASVMERVLGFVRAHPRIRGRFDHLYLDRARSIELRSTGRFAIERPRIGITIDEGEVRRVAIDATTARVLVPRDREPALALAFRMETTPLPALLAVLDGTTPLADAYALRTIDAGEDDVIELRPTDPTSQLDRLWLGVGPDGAIERVLVVDWRGATHRVVLTQIEYPRRIPESALAPPFPADAIVIEP
jgi:hypothetical protein